MTDRAKKISELLVTGSVVNTDKIIVLKDAANSSIATTKAIEVGNLALSIHELMPNSAVTANTVTATSNGTSYVTVYTFSTTNYDVAEIKFKAEDTTTGDITTGNALLVANSTVANAVISTTRVGNNQILFDDTPVVSANAVAFKFRRASSAASNVIFKFVASTY